MMEDLKACKILSNDMKNEITRLKQINETLKHEKEQNVERIVLACHEMTWKEENSDLFDRLNKDYRDLEFNDDGCHGKFKINPFMVGKD